MPKKEKRRAGEGAAGPDVVDSERAKQLTQLSGSLVFGEVTAERQAHLVSLTPDTDSDVRAKYPEIAQMAWLAEQSLYVGTDLSDDDRNIFNLVLRKRGFTPFHAYLELMSRIPHIQDEIDALVGVGVPVIDLLTALTVTAHELQWQALRMLPVAKQALGQKRGHLTTFMRSAKHLGIDPDLVRLLELNIDQKMTLIARTEEVIGKFERATQHLTRKTKTPLIRAVRVRVAQLLLDCGFPRGEAFRRTASLLRKWNPERFQGLTELHVRRSYQRRRHENRR